MMATIIGCIIAAILISIYLKWYFNMLRRIRTLENQLELARYEAQLLWVMIKNKNHEYLIEVSKKGYGFKIYGKIDGLHINSDVATFIHAINNGMEIKKESDL